MSEDQTPTERDLRFARGLASEAGAILRAASFRSHAADSKRVTTDLVTEFDRRSEKLIVDAIRARFPDDRILAEEGGEIAGAPGSTRRWLIDPLDGTTNFAHGLPFFCVSIALEELGALKVGVVQAPALGWSFWAAAGGGAWLGAHSDVRAVRVSETPSLSRALLATGFPYDRATSPDNNFAQFVHLKKQVHGIRRVGAASLDLAMVAAGWLDGYWEQKLKPWDLAAGALLVQEAGGELTSWTGGAFDVDSGAAVATNGLIHDELVRALSATPPL